MPIADALALRALGLSVLSLLPGAKAPAHKTWAPFQSRIASEDEIASWGDDTNVGVIAGEVSGGLLIDDLDDLNFIAWLREQPILGKLPYLVETGSHKLHIYLRTKNLDLHGENIDINGIHFGEIRGNGQYVVAPPSQVYNEDDHDQPYRYLRQDRIPAVTDARAFFHSLVNAYLGRDVFEQKTEPKIFVPLNSQELAARVERAYGLSKEIKQTILKGTQMGKGLWKQFPSHSQVDFAVVENLIRCGFTDQEIETIFALFPVGAGCYQNKERPGSSGSAYMALTLKQAHKKRAKVIEAAEGACGDDFRVLKVVKKMYDDPVYEITVEGPEGVPAQFECSGPEIISEAMFRKELAVALNFIPQFTARGKDYEKFADSILRLAVIEEVPEASKISGFLRTFLLDQLRRKGKILPDKPLDHRQMVLGYVDRMNGHTYIRGTQLMHLGALALRPAPKPGEVWEILRRWGAEEVEVMFEETGVTEELWSLPSEVLKEN